jgi:hypothetical protein
MTYPPMVRILKTLFDSSQIRVVFQVRIVTECQLFRLTRFRMDVTKLELVRPIRYHIPMRMLAR